MDCGVDGIVNYVSCHSSATATSIRPRSVASKGGKAMNKVVCPLLLLFLTGATFAQAQQPTNVSRIGYLSGNSPSGISARTEAFRQGLRELGYLEGKNIVIEYRYGEGKLDLLPALAAELVHLKVDVIVTTGSTATRTAKAATSRVPIVMESDNDPIGNGFVASLARPGGNITGLSNLAQDLSGKQLELLKEIVPKLSRVAVFGTSTTPGNAESLKEIELAARAFGVRVQYLDILDPDDIETAFQAASKGRAGAVLVQGTPFASSHRARITDLAAKNRLPATYPQSDYIDAGGLMFYGPSINDLFRRATIYVA